MRRLAADRRGTTPSSGGRWPSELGLQGLAVPEEYGGSGFGYVELGIVFEEMGRALLCAPYFATVALAAEALLRCARRAGQEATSCPASPSGETIGHAGAHRGQRPLGRGGHQARPPPTTDGGWRLNGVQDATCPTATSPTCSWSPPARPRASASSRSDADAPGLDPHPAAHPRPDPQAGPARVRRTRPARLLGAEGDGVAGPRAHPRHRRRGCWPPSRSAAPRPRLDDGRRVRQDPRAVRAADRLVPGHQAQVRRHAASRSSRPARPPTTRLWALAERQRRSCRWRPRLAKAYCSEAYFQGRRRQHPGPRRHRLHLGAPRAPVLQAGQELRGAARHTRRTTGNCSPPGSASEASGRRLDMELDFGPAVRDFRDEVRDWLADHLVGEFAEHRGVGGPTDGAAWEVRLAWDRELSAGGWLGIGWPREYGGRGLGLLEEIVFEYEYARVNAPYRATVQRPRPARPDAPHDGRRGAEEAFPAADPRRRGAVGPGLQRAGRRLRPGVACAPGPNGTATSGWSAGRRCGRRSVCTPTGSTSYAGPTRSPRGTRA